LVYVAAVADRPDGDDAGLVVYGVDDAVVTCSYPQPGRMTLEGFATCGPRIGGEGAHFGQHIVTSLGVELA
jgi:hypothetical protein